MGTPTETYVDPSIAADSGAGTSGDPYGDLQYALDTVTRDSTNGDRFNIKSGTDEILSSSLSLATYGSPGTTSPLIFQGYTTTAEDGGIGGISGNGSVAIWNNTINDYIHWVDLHLHTCGAATIVTVDVRCSFTNCEFDNTTGGGVVTDSACRFFNCYFHNIGAVGIQVAATAIIEGCYFKNETNDFTTAILSTTADSYIGSNTLDLDGTSNGIVFSSHRNLIKGNSVFSSAGTGTGIEITSGYNQILINNICEGFSGTGGIGFDLQSGADFILYGNNAAYNNATNYNENSDFISDIGNNETLLASPFTNAGSADFTIDTTVKATAYPTDNYNGLSIRTHLDKGALQREEAGGSASGVRNPVRGPIG